MNTNGAFTLQTLQTWLKLVCYFRILPVVYNFEGFILLEAFI